MQDMNAGSFATAILCDPRKLPIQRWKDPMKSIVLAAVFATAMLNPLRAVAHDASKRATPISTIQPTASSVRQAQSAKGRRTETEREVDEIIERNEREICAKLNICR